MQYKNAFLGFLLAVTVALPVHAQMTNADIADRLDKIEHDLMILQRQTAQSHGDDSGDSNGDSAGSPPGSSSPATDVQFSNMEDEIRALRGRVEQNEFQNKQLSDRLTKLQQDTDFRLNELASAKASAAAESKPSPDSKVASAKPSAPADSPEHISESDESEPAAPATTGGNGTLEKPSDEASFDTPRDLYNYAFRLMNQTRYDEAATSFKRFTEKYPKDPLIGNAFYWLGESYYIRHDYVQAADNFRQGFEALPEGPKAADNLLKLSMALSAMKKTSDACVVLDQLVTKFRSASTSITQKAESEKSRLNCK